MSKKKNTRDWVNTDWDHYNDFPEDDGIYKKVDRKRKDSKKRRIQNARRNKNAQKDSFFTG